MPFNSISKVLCSTVVFVSAFYLLSQFAIFGPMLEQSLKECSGLLKETDRLLRKLEKSSKILTQHVQTSILAARLQGREEGSSTLKEQSPPAKHK